MNNNCSPYLLHSRPTKAAPLACAKTRHITHEAQMLFLSGVCQVFNHSFHAAVSLRVLRAVACRVSLLRLSKMACGSGTRNGAQSKKRTFAHLSDHSLRCLTEIKCLSSPAFKRWQLPTCKQHQSTPAPISSNY